MVFIFIFLGTRSGAGVVYSTCIFKCRSNLLTPVLNVYCVIIFTNFTLI